MFSGGVYYVSFAGVHQYKLDSGFIDHSDKSRKTFDPIRPVAEEIADETWLLCFDEFQVRFFFSTFFRFDFKVPLSSSAFMSFVSSHLAKSSCFESAPGEGLSARISCLFFSVLLKLLNECFFFSLSSSPF